MQFLIEQGDLFAKLFHMGDGRSPTVLLLQAISKAEEEEDVEESEVESLKHFENYVKKADKEKCSDIILFITRQRKIQAWDNIALIKVLYHQDLETLIYPTAQACLSVITLPTCHTSQGKFDEHFD